MDHFLQLFISGIFTGGTYALIALALVVLIKATGVFNFAQGDLVMIGAYIVFFFAAQLGWPLWLSLIAGFGASALLGLVLNQVAFRPMIGQPMLSAVLMTLALSYLLKGVALIIWGAPYRSFPPIVPTGIVRFGPVVLSIDQAVSFGLALAAFGVFVMFFQWSRTGLSMRAVAEDHQAAQSAGIRVNRVFGISWAAACVLGTAAGILVATNMGLNVSVADILLKALPVVILGGLESIPGCIVAGLLVGVVENLGDFYIGHGVKEIMPYLLLLIVLLVRPHGLFGLKRIERI